MSCLVISNYQITKFLQFFLLYSLVVFCLSSPTQLCHNEESIALLQFKKLFSFNCPTSMFYNEERIFPPKTDKWKEGTDCCTWDGVRCDNTTGYVIGLDLSRNCLYGTIHPNSSLFNLVHLQELDLSWNNFNHSQILPSFGCFTNLTHLNLSNSYLSGQIQSSEVLEGNNYSNSIFYLRKLQELRLSGNSELTGTLPSFINGTLQHLRLLELYYCNLSGTIPRWIGNLTNSLRYLDLGGYNLNSGQFPSSISQLKNLKTLFLDNCNISGTIPRSLGNLTQLTHLYLSSNHFSGKIIPSSLSYLENLLYLDLALNMFEGPIPQLFSNSSQLVFLDFSYNQLTGPIPSSIITLPHLENLRLDNNLINGTIPSSLFLLVNLTSLKLSSNNLSDTVELDIFAKLENLLYLDLSNSGLSLTTVNSARFSFPNIRSLRLSSCNISTIPESLKTRKDVLETLDLSNNKINEELSPSICNLRSLLYLDLSNNQFYGLIPTCLGKFTGNLSVLYLQRNNFHGSIRQTFGFGNMLQALDISHNGLQGVLPRSLANCTYLEILNVGHNLIVDIFPFWLENLPELKVLILRDNKLHGPIGKPRNKSAFTNLHVIDVSHNEFTGTLPSKYFESWHSMSITGEGASQLNYMNTSNYYFYKVTIMNKGIEMVYEKIITTLVVVDFSCNKFHGKIPISIGKLKALHVLNFSRNDLSGPIPSSVGNLIELESLDLSKNKLSGEIPQQLTSLTFLAVFNVSQNYLMGIIPRGLQFETFSNTSYEGNSGLCGFPMSKKCGNHNVASSPSSLSHNFKYKLNGFGWEAVLMGYGCGVVLGLVIGSFITQRKEEQILRIFGVKIRQQRKRTKKG